MVPTLARPTSLRCAGKVWKPGCDRAACERSNPSARAVDPGSVPPQHFRARAGAYVSWHNGHRPHSWLRGRHA
jgi:hypothetical protein